MESIARKNVEGYNLEETVFFTDWQTMYAFVL